MKNKHLLLFLLLAGILRLAYIFTLEDRAYYFDTAHYDQAACAILEQGDFGGSLHYYNEFDNYCLEPVYPIFLASVYKLFGHSFFAVRIMQMLLGLFQLFMLYKMVQFLRPRAAIYVLLFGSVYPFFIYISGLLYVTQLFALLLTLTFYFFLRYSKSLSLWWLALSAVCLGVAVAARPVALPSTLLIAAWIFFLADTSWVKKIGHIAFTALIVIAVLAPWTIRNWLVFETISPGRACLAETRIFEKVDLEFRIEDSEKLTVFPGTEFTVNVIDTADVLIYECLLDEKLVAKLKVNKPFERRTESWYGLIFKGGAAMHITGAQFLRDKEVLLNTRFDDNMSAAKEFVWRDGSVTLAESESRWQYPLMFEAPASVDVFKLFYPATINPKDVSRVALLFNMDAPTLQANGYMIWLHPWMQADLWKVENGRPARPVETVDLLLKENPVNVAELVKNNPLRFVIKHIVPEFLNFWSPVITRITTSANMGMAMNAMSLLFFTPLLLFFIIGLFVIRDQWKSVLILLIPIVTISMFYSVFFTELRYRIPIDAFLIVLAAIGFERIVRLAQRRH